MALSFEAERTLLGGAGTDPMNPRTLERAIHENRIALLELGRQFPSAAAGFKEALRGLERLHREAWADRRLDPSERSSLRTALQGVSDTRVAAMRGEIGGLVQNEGERGIYRDPGSGEIVRRDPGARTLLEQAEARDAGLVQNEGERGIYRDPGTGEIVRRDPGARTLLEQAEARDAGLVQNEGERGIYRDPGTGEIVRRDPGAKTALERADETERYATSGRRAYRNAPTAEQVANGARELREGDRGPAVRELQALLVKAGFDVGPKGADGYYGPKTAEGAAAFLASIGSAKTTIGHEELARLRVLAGQS